MNLDELTLTLINLLIAIGSAEAGFAEELIGRKGEIIKAFSSISGSSLENIDYNAKIGYFKDELWEGYYFKLIDGVYTSTYDAEVAGW